MNVHKRCYRHRRSGVDDPQAVRIDIGGLTLWFSYHTLVAFCMAGRPPVVHQNVWGPTTGKHLNIIDGGDKDSRVSKDEFDLRWAQLGDIAVEQGINLLRG